MIVNRACHAKPVNNQISWQTRDFGRENCESETLSPQYPSLFPLLLIPFPFRRQLRRLLVMICPLDSR